MGGSYSRPTAQTIALKRACGEYCRVGPRSNQTRISDDGISAMGEMRFINQNVKVSRQSAGVVTSR